MLSFFPRDVLDEIMILIESVFECFPSYSFFSGLDQIRILIWPLQILDLLKFQSGLPHIYRTLP